MAFLVVGFYANIFGIFGDGFALFKTEGRESGGVEYYYESETEEEFFARISEVRNEFLLDRQMVCDSIYVAATFHVLQSYNPDIIYGEIDESEIQFVFRSSQDGELGLYSEEKFRDNLRTIVIPNYLLDDEDRSILEEDPNHFDYVVDEIFQYVEDFYSIIDEEMPEEEGVCLDGNTCTYRIKGYALRDTRKEENIDVSNLYVRLMECGNTGKALKNETLVPFEKYVLGVIWFIEDKSTDIFCKK